MSNTVTFNSISEIHRSLGLGKPKHPLVSVVQAKDIQKVSDFQHVKVVMNVYQIIFKSSGCGPLIYGRNSYDYQEGTLLFTAPGQVMEYENDLTPEDMQDEGWSLGFHPDLLGRSNLAKKIDGYSFFEYASNEALHVSESELTTIEELLNKIVIEYSQNLDKHSQNLITTNIELLLDYCVRFYDRQFYTRTNLNHDIVSNFEQLLKTYYKSSLVYDLGIPTVHYCANELNLTPSYFGDLIKKETGKSAQEHIHIFIIEKAKASLLNSTDTVSQIGYSLGFEYPQHFSNLFKAKTGISPREYRSVH